MTKYRDPFGNPIAKKDLTLACQIVVIDGVTAPIKLHREMRCGIGRAGRLLRILEDAGIIIKQDNGKKIVVLRNMDGAINAALRQLKKGRQ